MREAVYLHRAVIIFEGGSTSQHPLQQQILRLRHAVTLDNLVKYQQSGAEEVVLATDHPDLAREAARLGVRVRSTQTGRDHGLDETHSCGAAMAHSPGTAAKQYFHFGKVLRQVVLEAGADAVLYSSGAALPLISQAEISWVLDTVAKYPPCVVVNNVQSVDLAAWNPASYITRIAPPESDNLLGWLLRDAGMEQILIPHSAAIHFDLDTPTDYLILRLSGQAGSRTQQALNELDWPMGQLQAAADLLASDLPEIALIGRVGTSVVEHINRNLRVRVRVFSEERGVKALGRDADGSAVSLMADLLEDVGPVRFFQRLASICDAVFFDTRVLFAHRGRRVSESDRFHSDLGRVDAIQDPWVRAFTEAALASPIPVVLGGHSIVAGGLWVLADRAIAKLNGGTGVAVAGGKRDGSCCAGSAACPAGTGVLPERLSPGRERVRIP